jgi:putative membrane protein
MIVAAREHRVELRRIADADDYFYRARRSLALTVAVGVVCIGVVAFVGILARHRPA